MYLPEPGKTKNNTESKKKKKKKKRKNGPDDLVVPTTTTTTTTGRRCCKNQRVSLITGVLWEHVPNPSPFVFFFFFLCRTSMLSFASSPNFLTSPSTILFFFVFFSSSSSCYFYGFSLPGSFPLVSRHSNTLLSLFLDGFFFFSFSEGFFFSRQAATGTRSSFGHGGGRV